MLLSFFFYYYLSNSCNITNCQKSHLAKLSHIFNPATTDYILANHTWLEVLYVMCFKLQKITSVLFQTQLRVPVFLDSLLFRLPFQDLLEILGSIFQQLLPLPFGPHLPKLHLLTRFLLEKTNLR